MTFWRPLATLIAIATFVPELLTGSTPVSGYFVGPTTPLFVIFYGFAILCLREFATRINMSIAGIAIAGLGYGVLNEGLVAKTLLLPIGIPIPQYDGYGLIGVTSLPWAASILVFHTLASVLFPILATQWLFPQNANEPWLSKRVAMVLASVVVVAASLIYLGSFRGNGSLAGLLFQWLLIAAFVGGGSLLSKNPSLHNAPRLAMANVPIGAFAAMFNYMGLSTIAGAKLPLAIYFAALCAATAVCIWLVRRKGPTQTNVLLFTIGWLIVISLLAILGGLAQPATLPERAATGVIGAAMLVVLARAILRRTPVVTIA